MTVTLTPADLCLPVLDAKPFTADGWLFELKHDGFRALVRCDGESVELLSRHGRPMAEAFPEVVLAARAGLPDGVFDGEVVVTDGAGRSDFGELQRRALMRKHTLVADATVRRPAALLIFDVLASDGQDLREVSLAERKQWLHAHVSVRPSLRLVEGVERRGEALFESIAARDFEGIVAKRLDSQYKAGLQRCWRKIKNPGYSRKAH